MVSDNDACFRSSTFAALFTRNDPLLRHVRARVRSPQIDGVIERFFGALQYEHLYCGLTGDGSALHMEVHRYQRIYNPIRPHQVLGGHSQSRGT